MKRFKTCFCILAALAAMAAMPTFAYAAPEDDDEERTVVTTEAPEEDSPAAATTVTKYDYFGDPYYDTDGNATLVESRDVIYSSAQLQFIAVTTKSGNVFYVVIDYTKNDGQNVYFLNKVDDYDLYALMNSGDSEAMKNYTSTEREDTNISDSKTTQTDSVPADVKVDDTPKKPSVADEIFSKENKIIFACLGVLFVGFGIYAYFKMRGKKKKIDDDDDFYEDDEEINEDDQ